MTREQAMKEARKRWGARAMIKAGQEITSEERRERARAERLDIKQKLEALAKERAERLKALDWLQAMDAEIRALRAKETALISDSTHYKFSVGKIDDILGAFFVRGQGDTWEQAFERAVK
jgi:hypothetical protein